MLDRWLNPIPIVREYIASKRMSIRAARQKTAKERVRDIQHKNLNREKDGRINFGFDENGKVLAHSVSPYSKEFMDAIEPKIKPLIQALRSKLYLTMSSCQSHCMYSRRYVTLAFWSKKSAENFAYEVSRILPSVKFQIFEPEEYMNVAIKWSENGNFSGLERCESTRDASIRSLNVMFDRNYQDYAVLEMVIAPEMKSTDSFLSRLKIRIYKMFFMERVTKRLTSLILSNNVSWYEM